VVYLFLKLFYKPLFISAGLKESGSEGDDLKNRTHENKGGNMHICLLLNVKAFVCLQDNFFLRRKK
jgi:hypothetical protein